MSKETIQIPVTYQDGGKGFGNVPCTRHVLSMPGWAAAVEVFAHKASYGKNYWAITDATTMLSLARNVPTKKEAINHVTDTLERIGEDMYILAVSRALAKNSNLTEGK